MAAMIFSSPPPQYGQCSMSMSKTLEQPRPADAMRPSLDGFNVALGGRGSFGGWLLLLE
jgi:hypothetical protein